MGDLATLPTFQPAPTSYTHADFNAAFAALTIANSAVSTNKLADQAVTFQKMQNVATATLLGRSTGGPGAVESITLGGNLALAGGVLNLPAGINSVTIGQTTPAAGSFTTLSASGVITSAAVGQWLDNSTTGSVASNYMRIRNTGGVALFGVEDSTGATFGATAYDTMIFAAAGKAITQSIGGVLTTRTTNAGLAVTGTGSFSGRLAANGALVAGKALTVSANHATEDCLHFVDSNGAPHLSWTVGIGAGDGANQFGFYNPSTGKVVSITTAGVAITGALTISTALAIAQGGTGQTGANAGFNALAPAQGGNNGKFLTTDGSNTSWATVSGGGGTIGGSTGGTTNAVIKANGTGGSTIQASGVIIDGSNNVTGAATYDAGTGGYKVSGTKVLGAQAAAESDFTLSTSISGSDTLSIGTVTGNFAALNGKLNSLLAKLRTHGLIAP